MDSTIFTYDPPSYVKDWIMENLPPKETIFDFGNGDISAIYLSGNIITTDLSIAGLKTGNSVWTKQPISIKVGNDVTSLSTSVFRGAAELTSIKLHNGITGIMSYAMNACYSIQHVDIPDSVVKFGLFSFSNCSSLLDMSFPDGVSSLPQRVCQGCKSISSIHLPESLSSLNTYAFYNCYSLLSIRIPPSVSAVTGATFQNCSSLIDVDMREYTSVPTLGSSSAFEGCNANMQIAIPDGLYDEWMTSWSSASWKTKIIKASESRLGPLM